MKIINLVMIITQSNQKRLLLSKLMLINVVISIVQLEVWLK